MAAFWQNGFMSQMRNTWINRISRAQYYANGHWYDAEITTKEVVGNDMHVSIVTPDDGQNLTITKVRLIDINGEVAGLLGNENITKSGTQSLIMQFEFPLYEID